MSKKRRQAKAFNGCSPRSGVVRSTPFEGSGSSRVRSYGGLAPPTGLSSTKPTVRSWFVGPNCVRSRTTPIAQFKAVSFSR